MAEPLAIAWRPDFATGVAIIDDQHRVLVNMLNEANTKLTDRSPIADFSKIVQGLLAYAGYHFKTEEGLMDQHGYDACCAEDAARHRAQHQAFAEKVIAVQASLAAGQRIPKADLVDFLTQWLTDHILNTDRDFGKFICSRPAA